ncbi:hypothetical protein D3C80_1953310 [compost metagenome]
MTPAVNAAAAIKGKSNIAFTEIQALMELLTVMDTIPKADIPRISSLQKTL